MTKLLSKFQSITSNPGMLAAYLRWVGSRLVSGKPPRLLLPGGTTIGEWVSFSEYWSFQEVISEPEQLFIKHRLANKTEAVAFDIGANVGAFTCLIASLGHTVHTFEPIPETFCRMKNNVKSNGLLEHSHLNCLALGAEQDLVTFHIEEFGAATNRMVLPGAISKNSATSTQLVAVTSLDIYCQKHAIQHIDFIKLDVEGMEPFVLQGAKTLLQERRIAAILIEICPLNLRAVGLAPSDLFREFATARYSAYALQDDGRPGSRLSLSEIEAVSLVNVILLPDA